MFEMSANNLDSTGPQETGNGLTQITERSSAVHDERVWSPVHQPVSVPNGGDERQTLAHPPVPSQNSCSKCCGAHHDKDHDSIVALTLNALNISSNSNSSESQLPLSPSALGKQEANLSPNSNSSAVELSASQQSHSTSFQIHSSNGIRSRKQMTKKDYKSVTCHSCGVVGHIATHCPTAPSLCRKCGKPGHNANLCRHNLRAVPNVREEAVRDLVDQNLALQDVIHDLRVDDAQARLDQAEADRKIAEAERKRENYYAYRRSVANRIGGIRFKMIYEPDLGPVSENDWFDFYNAQSRLFTRLVILAFIFPFIMLALRIGVSVYISQNLTCPLGYIKDWHFDFQFGHAGFDKNIVRVVTCQPLSFIDLFPPIPGMAYNLILLIISSLMKGWTFWGVPIIGMDQLAYFVFLPALTNPLAHVVFSTLFNTVCIFTFLRWISNHSHRGIHTDIDFEFVDMEPHVDRVDDPFGGVAYDSRADLVSLTAIKYDDPGICNVQYTKLVYAKPPLKSFSLRYALWKLFPCLHPVVVRSPPRNFDISFELLLQLIPGGNQYIGLTTQQVSEKYQSLVSRIHSVRNDRHFSLDAIVEKTRIVAIAVCAHNKRAICEFAVPFRPL